jgi:hypothetical protein
MSFRTLLLFLLLLLLICFNLSSASDVEDKELIAAMSRLNSTSQGFVSHSDLDLEMAASTSKLQSRSTSMVCRSCKAAIVTAQAAMKLKSKGVMIWLCQKFQFMKPSHRCEGMITSVEPWLQRIFTDQRFDHIERQQVCFVLPSWF